MKFRDLGAQYACLKKEIDNAIGAVLESSTFIGGPQVRDLEAKLAEYVGVKHCITCGNGTDAITLALMAWNVNEKHAVFVPDFTFFASGECPALEGATPIFVDVDEKTYNLDAEKLEAAILKIQHEGNLIPKVVIAVDLFGQPADYESIRAVCGKYDLLLLEDGAQGFGGAILDRRACSFGDISTTSFFPAKPLGCYGDGGAVFTDNDEWAELIRSYAVHGKGGNDKYNNIRIGMNSRLDAIQAAVLLPKLKAFSEHELDAVNEIAGWYNDLLRESGLITPYVKKGYISSWAQYTIRLPESIDRNALQLWLREKDIPTMVYYGKPMHVQQAFENTKSADAMCDITVKLCESVLSLPMHPYLTYQDVEFICKNILEFLKNEA